MCVSCECAEHGANRAISRGVNEKVLSEKPKQERKARKAREKATGVQTKNGYSKGKLSQKSRTSIHSTFPKSPSQKSLQKQQRTKYDRNKRHDKFVSPTDPIDKTQDRWAPGFDPDHKRYIVCLKHGNKYSAEYVNKLYWMCKRHTTLPFEFVCFTENPQDLVQEIRVETLPKVRGVNGWWYKPNVFPI